MATALQLVDDAPAVETPAPAADSYAPPVVTDHRYLTGDGAVHVCEFADGRLLLSFTSVQDGVSATLTLSPAKRAALRDYFNRETP